MDYNQQPVAPLSFEAAVKRVFNNYANFQGRASRAEFWWFMLFCFCVNAVFGILTAITGLSIFNYLDGLFGLAIIVPVLAVSWRRLHDTGRAGGWWFINFVPLVGSIIFIIWAVQPSEPQPNRFGPVPAC